jgi:hypothetical protein
MTRRAALKIVSMVPLLRTFLRPPTEEEMAALTQFSTLPIYPVPTAPAYALVRYRDYRRKADIWRLHTKYGDGEYGLEAVVTDTDRAALHDSYGDESDAWLDDDSHMRLLDCLNEAALKRGVPELAVCTIYVRDYWLHDRHGRRWLL